MATLVLENDSEETICYVLISPAENDNWGEDWLGDSETIEPGQSHTLDVPVGVYDLQALDCDENELATEWDTALNGTTTWTISGAAPAASGDELDFTEPPNFGNETLDPGFQPDPYTVDVVSGGAVDVEALGLGDDCGGYASVAPDFRLNLTANTDQLRIFFVADGDEDATLIVSDSYSNWHCNDDFSGWDPLIELENAESGQYDIWIGSYSADEYIAGTLYITELDFVPGDFTGEAPSGDGDSLGFNETPNFGTEELESGFQPDPYMVDVISGGDVDVAAQGLGSDCGGYASVAPDFRLNLADNVGQLRFFFVADGGEDATLIINDPYSNWYCNDDFAGLDPMTEFQNAESGQYDIWIGSYSADEYIAGTLYITGLDYDPGNLP